MATPTPREEFNALLDEFRTAMLVTHSEDGELRARPMYIASKDPEGAFWFVTDSHSPKLEEIAADSRVSVTMQGKRRYVSITGTAAIREDTERVRELWSEAWRPWFPKGADDPNIRLLELQPTCGEYWDLSGTNGFRYAFEAGKAILKKDRIDYRALDGHGKVTLE